MSKALEDPRKAFVSNLPLVMNKAGELKLWKTMHALHGAVRAAGWELAEQLIKESTHALSIPAKKKRKRK